MNSAPLRYARENVIFGADGRAAAMYRLPTVSYALLPDEAKHAWKWTVAGLVLAAQADVSIYRVQRRWPTEGYVAQAEGLVDAQYQDPGAWRAFLESHRPRLDELESHLPEVYLRVALPAPPAGGMRDGVDRVYRRLCGTFGAPTGAPISQRRIEQIMDAESLMLDAVRRSLPGAEPMSTRELQWLCRRAAVRHVAEPALDEHWAPNALLTVDPAGDGALWEPRDSDFLPLFHATIRREQDHVVVRGYEAESYQAFLTLGTLPGVVEFPGAQAELLFRTLDALPFPVDAVIHGTYIANRKALSEVNKAVIDAENALDEASTGHHAPDELQYLNPELARALKTYLQSENQPPMLDATISYAIGAPNLAELRRRVRALAGQFNAVAIHHPAGLQAHLYCDHLPRPDGGAVGDYRQMLTIEQFGMLMPIATRDVGSRRGPYSGYTVANGRARSPVKTNLLAAAADALPTSVYLAGRQGSGKTLGAQLLAYQAAMRGSFVITADPSPTPDHHITELFAGESEVIGLDAKAEYRGTLDPLVVAPEELREEIAVDYYLGVLDQPRPGWETELTRAVRAVRRDPGGGGGSLAVLERLGAGNDSAREVASALEVVSDVGLGLLGFGDGNGAGARAFGDIKRVTTIRMGNLALPGPDVARAQYGRRERMAVATFRLVVAYIMWLVTRDRAIHKVVILDEAWALPIELLSRLVRLGRKFNTTVLICSQTISDLGELKSLIGMYFIFGVNDSNDDPDFPGEAQRAVALIGLDPRDAALCARLADRRQFAKGRCLHRDLQGRVADMQIDPVDPEVLRALKTEPPEESAAA